MRLLITLHGRTPLSVAQKFLGQFNDPLDELGRLQAEALADRLALETLAAVVSSPLDRAYDTAAAIASRHDLPVIKDPDLLEVNMGDWEGRVQADVKGEKAALFARWLEDATLHYPAGGESLSAMCERVARALARWQAAYPTRAGEPEPTLVWTTHPAFTGVMMCFLLGLPLPQRRNFHTDNASLSEVHLAQRERGVVPVLRSFNDTAHVRERGLWKPPSHSYLYID
jgi:broad specificity phosphatase PhoE